MSGTSRKNTERIVAGAVLYFCAALTGLGAFDTSWPYWVAAPAWVGSGALALFVLTFVEATERVTATWRDYWKQVALGPIMLALVGLEGVLALVTELDSRIQRTTLRGRHVMVATVLFLAAEAGCLYGALTLGGWISGFTTCWLAFGLVGSMCALEFGWPADDSPIGNNSGLVAMLVAGPFGAMYWINGYLRRRFMWTTIHNARSLRTPHPFV